MLPRHTLSLGDISILVMLTLCFDATVPWFWFTSPWQEILSELAAPLQDQVSSLPFLACWDVQVKKKGPNFYSQHRSLWNWKLIPPTAPQNCSDEYNHEQSSCSSPSPPFLLVDSGTIEFVVPPTSLLRKSIKGQQDLSLRSWDVSGSPSHRQGAVKSSC